MGNGVFLYRCMFAYEWQVQTYICVHLRIYVPTNITWIDTYMHLCVRERCDLKRHVRTHTYTHTTPTNTHTHIHIHTHTHTHTHTASGGAARKVIQRQAHSKSHSKDFRKDALDSAHFSSLFRDILKFSIAIPPELLTWDCLWHMEYTVWTRNRGGADWDQCACAGNPKL